MMRRRGHKLSAGQSKPAWLKMISLCTIATALTACAPANESLTSKNESPARIVSLDYCADQYLLKLADRDDILALSPDANASFSYMRDAATGIRQVRPIAEDVLALQPDLIIRSYGGGPNAQAFFQRAGIPVLQIGFVNELDQIAPVTQAVADGLHQSKRGEALIAHMDARIASLPEHKDGPATLYMTPGGVTSGPGSLVHDMLLAAGLANFETKPGWHPIPLEKLVRERPDHVAASFFSDTDLAGDGWSAARHPIARTQTETLPTTRLEGAWTACGTWFLLDAVEALAKDAYP